MNCFVHDRVAAVGMCAVCQKAVCRDCVVRSEPRIVCRTCAEGGVMMGFEYRSEASIGSWPLVHICTGLDPVTQRPKVARGVIAIGNIAVGGLAIGGVALGLVSLAGLSVGLLVAVGGGALGVGVSFGGLAVGSVAVGGLAIGFSYAFGGLGIGPAVIDSQHCSEAARAFAERWLGSAFRLPACR